MSALAEKLAPPQVRWDLSALFDRLDDPRIGEFWIDAKRRAESFAQRFRGKVASLSGNELAKAIQELESLAQDVAKPMSFSELLFAADCSNPAHGAFMQAQMEKGSELRLVLMFFELEIQAASEETVQKWLSDPALKSYGHYLRVARVYSPHRLSEEQEAILEETANTGVRAWVRLHDELTSNQVYRFKDPSTGEVKELTQQQVLDLLRQPDRAIRLAAGDAFSAGLKELERALVLTYNNILADKKLEDRLRKHPYAEHSRHLNNELDKETVDLVTGLCKEKGEVVARYYRVKKEILGLSELTHVDRYAPLFETKEQVEWSRGRSIVLESFAGFSQEMASRAAEFFEKNWIDAEPRTGKTGGAFCSYVTPDTHPFVLMSYLNKMDDVMTLAHELGHGVHASLSREQSYFNFHGTLPLAELASIFGEMLVFEALVAKAEPKDKLALYAEKIEGIFASVFRQASMFRFEQRCHVWRREKGELSPEQFGQIWQEELQSMFGDSIKLGEQHRLWWAYVGHFIFAPFYVYAYSFGELLTLSLYQKAKTEGSAFAGKYIELLRLGGSRSPRELMSLVGADLSSREFWLGGFTAIEKLVGDFEAMWAEYGA